MNLRGQENYKEFVSLSIFDLERKQYTYFFHQIDELGHEFRFQCFPCKSRFNVSLTEVSIIWALTRSQKLGAERNPYL